MIALSVKNTDKQAGDKMKDTKEFSVEFSIYTPSNEMPSQREWATVNCADATQVERTLRATLKAKGDIGDGQYLTIHRTIAED